MTDTVRYMTYPVLRILPGVSTQLEQLGTKGKFWYIAEDGSRALFKEGRPGTGENWAEKVCCEIARLLGLPHAEYELAVWNDRRGVSTRSIVPDAGRLILGNELLATVTEQYDPISRYRVSQHTLRRVMAVMGSSRVLTPLDWPCPTDVKDARGVFAGYVLLDALVGNQDRHHENWGLILSADGRLTLAATFDHASSLGRNETDASRVERLSTKDRGRSVAHYASRARSGLYEAPSSGRPMGTLEAFQGTMRYAPDAGSFWLRRLSEATPALFKEILERTPNDWITEPAVDFAFEMIITNRNRLLGLSASS